MALLRLVGRRVLQLPIMILGISMLVFVVMSFSNVDPAIQALGEGSSVEAREAYRAANGLDDPLLVRYLAFLAGLVQGDLGTFSARQTPVAAEVARALPVTLQLTFMGLLLAVVLALVLGVLAALFRDRWPDKAIRVVSVGSLAMPSFWLAVLLIQLVTLGTGALPASGRCRSPRPTSAATSPGWRSRRSRSPCLSSASSPGSCGRRWSRSSTRTTCAPRSVPASPGPSSSGATSCATPSSHPSPSWVCGWATSSAAPWSSR